MIGSYEEFARALEERPDGMPVLDWLANTDRGGADWSLWLVRWLREHRYVEGAWTEAPLAQGSPDRRLDKP